MPDVLDPGTPKERLTSSLFCWQAWAVAVVSAEEVAKHDQQAKDSREMKRGLKRKGRRK